MRMASIDPKSYKATTESLLAEKWDTVMKQESDEVGQDQDIGNVLELPDGRKALPSHRVYKIKRDGAGNVQWFKARLVCGGNHPIQGIDFQAMYAPTARFGQVRLALAIAAKYDLATHQMDICSAILGVDLDGEIYMHLPEASFCWVPGSQYCGPRSKTLRKMVLRLRQSLYGLK
jgi:hypothetical protein